MLVLFLTLVSDALNELDVVAVTSLVTFLVEVTVLCTVVVTTCFEGIEGFNVLVAVFVEILRRDWQ